MAEKVDLETTPEDAIPCTNSFQDCPLAFRVTSPKSQDTKNMLGEHDWSRTNIIHLVLLHVSFKWLTLRISKSRPAACKAAALASELSVMAPLGRFELHVS